MSFNTQKKIDSVVEYRGLPKIKKGMRCEVNGKQGKVTGGNNSCNLNVLFDGDKSSSNCHPYYKMTIFDKDGTIIHQSEDVKD